MEGKITFLYGYNEQGKTEELKRLHKTNKKSIYIDGSVPMEIRKENLAILSRNLSFIFNKSVEVVIKDKQIYFEVDFGISKDRKLFKYNEVGKGFRRVFNTLSNLIDANNRVILIENPEVYLCSQAQIRLMEILWELCMKNELKLFIETNSELLLYKTRVCVKDSKNNNVKVLYYGGNNVETIDFNEKGQLENHPYGFLEELDSLLEKLIF